MAVSTVAMLVVEFIPFIWKAQFEVHSLKKNCLVMMLQKLERLKVIGNSKAKR